MSRRRNAGYDPARYASPEQWYSTILDWTLLGRPIRPVKAAGRERIARAMARVERRATRRRRRTARRTGVSA